MDVPKKIKAAYNLKLREQFAYKVGSGVEKKN